MPVEPGTTLGPHNVTAKIGEGGMGEVAVAPALVRDGVGQPVEGLPPEARIHLVEVGSDVLVHLPYPGVLRRQRQDRAQEIMLIG